MLAKKCQLLVVSAQKSDSVQTAVCVSTSGPADGDDGEMQEAGQQVSAFKKCVENLTCGKLICYSLSCYVAQWFPV